MEKILEIDCKVVFLGDKNVGKTTIINQYINNRFLDNVEPTFSACFYQKSLNINGTKINFDIWDTAGEEAYRSLTKIFLNRANICILVYDTTKEKTFENIKNVWYNLILDHLDKEEIIFVLVGNKNDLYDQQEISAQEANLYAKEINAIYDELNALSNEKINILMEKIAKKFIKKQENNKSLSSSSLSKSTKLFNSINNKQKTNKKCC
jgi:small GTP-binding protein